jgi:hypothetical protein
MTAPFNSPVVAVGGVVLSAGLKINVPPAMTVPTPVI